MTRLLLTSIILLHLSSCATLQAMFNLNSTSTSYNNYSGATINRGPSSIDLLQQSLFEQNMQAIDNYKYIPGPVYTTPTYVPVTLFPGGY